MMILEIRDIVLACLRFLVADDLALIGFGAVVIGFGFALLDKLTRVRTVGKN